MVTLEKTAFLKNNFTEVLKTFFTLDDEIDSRWRQLVEAYSLKKRHYHNLNHIYFMVRKASELGDKLYDRNALLLSIYYHDYVYFATSKKNEEKSAQVLERDLSELDLFNHSNTQLLVVSTGDRIRARESRERIETLISKCKKQIIATKKHERSTDRDTNYLIDLDLAILGSDWKVYQNYAAAVRKEFSIYPDFLYSRGRKKALQHFLDQQSIFKTAEFENQYVARARDNMKRELNAL